MTPTSEIRALIEDMVVVQNALHFDCLPRCADTVTKAATALSEYAAFRDALDSAEMVERVARALAVLSAGNWRAYIEDATAVIAEIRGE